MYLTNLLELRDTHVTFCSNDLSKSDKLEIATSVKLN